MKKTILFLLLFLLVGCYQEEPKQRLKTPENISLVDFELLWDEVEDAVSYCVVINSVDYFVESPKLDVRQLNDGSYTVQVKAISLDKSESLFSRKFMFTLQESIRVPGNVKIQNDILSWSMEQDASKYIVKINDNEYEVKKNLYSLTTLEQNHFYKIQVKGVYRNMDSKYSEPLLYHTFKETFLKTEEVKFDKSSKEDLSMTLEDVHSIESLFFLDEEIIFKFDSNVLTIGVEVFEAIPYGNNCLIAYTDKGLVELNFYLYDSSTPYISTPQILIYEPGKDVVLDFVLFSSQIAEMNGRGISSSDYIISGEQVLIRHQYLDRQFADENREYLILGYYLLVSEADDATGFVKIIR